MIRVTGEASGNLNAKDALKHRIKRLYRENGEPSTREIARRAGHVVSHTTVGEILRGDRIPRWASLEPVVRALYGDRNEFLQLWTAARDGEAGIRLDDAKRAEGDSASTERADAGMLAEDEVRGDVTRRYAGISSSDYFCYVSQSKVERMYATMMAESADDAELAHPGVEELFRESGTFGRPGLLYGGSLNRPELMRRLRRVLSELARQGAIIELANTNPPAGALYLHHAGVFQALSHGHGDAADPGTEVVRVKCVSRPGLLLDCSLRYFSEAVNGRYVVSSESSYFVNGGGMLRFDTVFVILHLAEDGIVGSPLYLKLYSGEVGVVV